MRTEPSLKSGPPRFALWARALLLSALFVATRAGAGGASFGHWSGREQGSDHFQYALIGPGSRMQCSIGNEEVWGELRRLQKEVESTDREIFWFALGDRTYVVRDPATLRRAREIVEPMAKLGAQQGELGRQQGELGRQQGELGALQGRIGALQGRFSAMRPIGDDAAADELAKLRQQLQELTVYAHELGRRQRDLGQRQRELGGRQRALGERQREASRMAEAQLRTLAETSVRNGRAESQEGS